MNKNQNLSENGLENVRRGVQAQMREGSREMLKNIKDRNRSRNFSTPKKMENFQSFSHMGGQTGLKRSFQTAKEKLPANVEPNIKNYNFTGNIENFTEKIQEILRPKMQEFLQDPEKNPEK